MKLALRPNTGNASPWNSISSSITHYFQVSERCQERIDCVGRSSSYTIQTNDGQSMRGTTQASSSSGQHLNSLHTTATAGRFISCLLFSFTDHTSSKCAMPRLLFGLKKIQKHEGVVADDFVENTMRSLSGICARGTPHSMAWVSRSTNDS